MSRARAYAKINLTLVVGPLRLDSKHEIITVLQRIDLFDDIEVEPADELLVEGFPQDTLVRTALAMLAEAAEVSTGWNARIEKRIPVAAGLGGGSADAAAALELANALLKEPLPRAELHRIAARIGADVPFFLHEGAQLATGEGTDLTPVDVPQDYIVLLVLPSGPEKVSTEIVYQSFDGRGGAEGFEERRSVLFDALARVRQSRDLGELPRNDLASSPLAAELEALGAFRADVTGAGPAVYGLFQQLEDAERATAVLRDSGRTWLVRPISQR
jgi:4-diphosphocytidyl-2-C-methyl-D-erythritol kinase